MSIIAITDFKGTHSVPGLENQGTRERFQLLIDEKEPEFLVALLGYTLAQEFILGIQGAPGPIDPDYTKQERIPFNWAIAPVNSIDMTINNRARLGSDVHVEVWTESGLVREMVLPNYGVTKNQVGNKLVSIDLDIDLSFSAVKTGYILIYTSDYVYDTTDPDNPVPIDPQAKWIALRDNYNIIPMVVNYIYYWYLRESVTFSATLGEKKANAENAQPGNSITKQVKNWNDMSRMARVFNIPVDIYPTYVKPNFNRWRYWRLGCGVSEIYYPINDRNL